MKVHWSLSTPSDAALEGLRTVLDALPVGECRDALTNGVAFERELRKNWNYPGYTPHVATFELPLTSPAPYTGDGADPGMEMSVEAKALGDYLESALFLLNEKRKQAPWPDPVADEIHAAIARLVLMVGQAFRNDCHRGDMPTMNLN